MTSPLSSTKNHADFPMSLGPRVIGLSDHKGPSSYTVISIATPPTGGDAVVPQEFGLKTISALIPASGSDDGTYGVRALKVSDTSWILQWYTLATGAEVSGSTNLSAKTVTLFAIGR